MKTLTKEQALEFVPTQPKGQYQPRKYVLGGFIGSKREVLLHLYKQAVQAGVESRKLIEQDRLARGIEPLNRAKKSGNRPKIFWQNPRAIEFGLMVPHVRQYGDAWLIFTNCNLNGGFFKNIPGKVAQPERITFESALREIQPRRLP